MEARYSQSLMDPNYQSQKVHMITFSEQESLAHYHAMGERMQEAMEILYRDSPQSEPLTGLIITE